jgi:hypothetical protein
MSIDFDDTTGLFDRWLSPWRGHRQRIEHHGPRELPLDQQLDAVRRRDERIAELNRPPEPAGIVEQVLGAVAEAVGLVGKAKAAAFLREQLAHGPVAATEIERRAKTAGITRTALRRGRNALKIKPRKVGNAWFWALPAES